MLVGESEPDGHETGNQRLDTTASPMCLLRRLIDPTGRWPAGRPAALRGGWVIFSRRGQGLLMVIYYYGFGVKYI
ncbi:hypothetical protein AJ88_26915 [Mesorhizobium amorphae CCBAU 01583]|nr:hypothetical protein AJ88_26915 [Mesorhizobium amorphae CCBAU 01583]